MQLTVCIGSAEITARSFSFLLPSVSLPLYQQRLLFIQLIWFAQWGREREREWHINTHGTWDSVNEWLVVSPGATTITRVNWLKLTVAVAYAKRIVEWFIVALSPAVSNSSLWLFFLSVCAGVSSADCEGNFALENLICLNLKCIQWRSESGSVFLH